MSTSGRFRRNNGNNNGRSLAGTREVSMDVSKEACALVVGKGGRNIKELQQMDGIRYIRVDFLAGKVRIEGSDEGIQAAQNRINKAVCLASNNAGYFPENTMTCVRLNRIDQCMIMFQPINSFDANEFGGVQLEQLDKQRYYFVIDLFDHEDRGYDREADLNLERILVGYDEKRYAHFFETCMRENIEAMIAKDACTEIGVNFGKTFLSSVPEEAQSLPLNPTAANDLKYGKDGIRPTFARHFKPHCRDSLLDGLLDEYMPRSFGKFVVIHCTSQLAKKRYTIKLKCHDEQEDESTVRALPDVQSVRSKIRKLGLLNVLGDASQSEFRTTIEIERDETFMNRSMRQKLQEAWDARTSDGKFRFPDGTNDWLIVDTIRYKNSERYSNDTFELVIDTTIEENFGTTIEGVNISLKSMDVDDAVACLARASELSDKEELMSNLLASMCDLQQEAAKISSFLKNEAYNMKGKE